MRNDRSRLSLEQLESSDAEPLRRFWSRLSSETRDRRLMIPLASLEATHVARLLDVDHGDREAIVAVDEGQIVGEARYARRDQTDVAEVAVVVADAWQRRGVATCLLSALAAQARSAGIDRFEVLIQGDNGAALGLLRRLRPDARLAFVHGVLSGTVSIGADD